MIAPVLFARWQFWLALAVTNSTAAVVTSHSTFGLVLNLVWAIAIVVHQFGSAAIEIEICNDGVPTTLRLFGRTVRTKSRMLGRYAVINNDGQSVDMETVRPEPEAQREN